MIQTIDDRTEVFQKLRYAKRARGRHVTADVPRLGLRKGDRLHPSKSLWDVGQFERTTPPFQCLFWRFGESQRLRFRSPLFDVEGVNVCSWSKDLLHTWDLGPLLRYIATVLMLFITIPLWHSKASNVPAEENYKSALLQMKAKLNQHYERKRADVDWKRKGSEVSWFTLLLLFFCTLQLLRPVCTMRC